MIRPRWVKVMRDFGAHKTRTVLVVLSIAVGIFAAAMMIGARGILVRSLDTTFPASQPPAVTFLTTGFDSSLVSAVRRESSVALAQGRRVIEVSYRAGGGEWRNLTLYAFEDYDTIEVGKLDPPDIGRWPERGEVLMETGSIDYSGLEQGDTIELKLLGDDHPSLTVAGTVHDLNAELPITNGRVVGYISWDTLLDLEEPQLFNYLGVVSATTLRTLSEASAFGSELGEEAIVPTGTRVIRMVAHEPGAQVISNIFEGVSLLLVLVGVLTLLLSGFLVVNTVSAIVVSQTRQLGVMKTLGARRGQLAMMYFASVAVYGLLALAVALPLGKLGTTTLVEYGAGVLNYRVPDYSIPGEIVLMELAVGVLVPLLAAAVPVLLGMRMPVLEALHNAGSRFGEGRIDHLLGKLRGLPRPYALALRHTFTRKGRLALTLLTLIMAAGVFMAVASVRTSIARTVDLVGQHRSMDVWADVYPAQPYERVRRTALRVPGVTDVEGWIFRGSVRVRPDGSESPILYLNGLPAESRFYHPEIKEGRWIRPGEGNTIVIDEAFTEDNPDVVVGSAITLKIAEKEEVFRVVGFTRGDLLNQYGWIDRDYLDERLGTRGAVETLMFETEDHDAAAQSAGVRELSDEFASQGMRLANTLTRTVLQETIQASLDIVVVFLLVMAVLLVAVGGIGLSGTMSINVLESTRDIGVMRALGASSGAIYRIFIGEAVIVGLASWVGGALVSVPLSWWLTSALGDAMGYELTFAFSTQGVFAWLALVVVLSVLASLLPASRAARVKVAEAIAYE